MLHVGLDLSRRKGDVCLLSPAGEIVEEWAAPPDADCLRGLVRRAGAHGLTAEAFRRRVYIHTRAAPRFDDLDEDISVIGIE